MFTLTDVAFELNFCTKSDLRLLCARLFLPQQREEGVMFKKRSPNRLSGDSVVDSIKLNISTTWQAKRRLSPETIELRNDSL
ncbi:hypothetical protein Y032_0017g3277 [Ancylostoma ceylanicum]|uniref:Uncharacterized protein n=1 Tax=Ancylostoma ceylanicum TaxID=53326 RepID=A0A016V5L8_9BILA|nr:hypothetical protein Y032_0017g3277 [Ancylostoma ceylanicum]